MNLITFGFSEKGTPVFLNQDPYPQVGTMYLMKAGKNSVIGITLDDNAIKGTGKTKRGRKAKEDAAPTAPKKRGRKPKAEAAVAVSKKKAKKPGRPKAKKEKMVKKEKAEKKEEAV